MIARTSLILASAFTCAVAAAQIGPAARGQKTDRGTPGGFLSPCDVAGLKEKARCGTYEVWENRDAKAGRRIGLKVVVLPATGSPREPDAITFLGGGPGEAATEI